MGAIQKTAAFILQRLSQSEDANLKKLRFEHFF